MVGYEYFLTPQIKIDMSDKKRRILFVSALVTILFLNSCTVYTPAIQSPVTIKEKGQIQADANISFSSILLLPLGFNGSIAYGISDNTSVQLSTNMKLFDYYEYDISAGNYFINKNKFRLGLFPGYSYGKIDYLDMSGDIMSLPMNDWTGNYHNFYLRLQSLIDLKILTLGIGAKTGLFLPNLLMDNTIVNKKAIITQPTLYIKPNIEFDKISCGLSLTYLSLNTLGSFQNYNHIHQNFYNPFIVAFGFSYKFDTIKK